MNKSGTSGPFQAGANPPTGSESASRRIGDDPSGSFRKASETFRAVSPSSQKIAAARVVTPDPFDSTSSRCRCLVRVLCSPGSDSLEATYGFFSGYAKSRFRPQVAQRLSVAAYELLSNGLNYSSMADEITVELLDLPEVSAVRVVNETIGPRISMLTEHIGKLRHSAEATLLDEMRRSVAGGPVRPMLGLARVVHEASMQLDFVVTDRRVTLTASCRK
ncbi:MAG TPA: hypothetical protein VNG33_24060 [Polyangiaceae bacterium]|nr:hypothetical protein [Polyangiaceae bacterium]